MARKSRPHPGARKRRESLVLPQDLPLRDDAHELWNVVIETPKGSRNKYKFDPKLAAFKLSRVLPEGMSFPYDFGFLPRTRGDDGDPLDVLLLMDEPAFCGCVVPSRLIGLIEARQTEGKKQVRNDRLVAVPDACRAASDLCTMREIGKERLREIEAFFQNYNRELGKGFEILGVRGPRKARAAALAGRLH